MGIPAKLAFLKTLARAGRIAGPFFDAPPPKDFKNILVFQGGGVGDILRVFPLLISLHLRFPEARITTLTPFSKSVFRLFPAPEAVKESLPYEVRTIHRGPWAKFRLARALRRHGFDLLINPARGEGMIENCVIAYFTGAVCRVGFESEGAGFLNTVKLPLRKDRAIVEQNLDLLRAIGVEPEVKIPSVTVPRDSLDFAESFLKDAGCAARAVITVQPASQWNRLLQWPPERYSSLIRELIAAFDCRIVLIGAKGEEELCAKIATDAGKEGVINAAGKTTLTQAAALISKSRLFIGNDSGPLHLSIALKTPAVGIFGLTSPSQVLSPGGPSIALHKGSENLYLHEPFFRPGPGEKNPIELIEVAEVYEAASRLLGA